MPKNIEAKIGRDSASTASFTENPAGLPLRSRVVSSDAKDDSPRSRRVVDSSGVVRGLDMEKKEVRAVVSETTPPPREPFSLGHKLKATIFESPLASRFLGEWMSMHDDKLSVKRIPTDQLHPSDVLADGDDSIVINIPQRFSPWHVPAVVEALDEDTFRDRPEGKIHPQDTLRRTGETLAHVGAFIGERVAAIGGDAAQAATESAMQLYQYGEAVRSGVHTDVTEADVASKRLTPEQTAQVDAWFEFNFPAAGEEGYDPQAQEQKRVRMLNLFFEFTQKAAAGSERHAKAVDRVLSHYLDKPSNEPELVLEKTLVQRGQEIVIAEVGWNGWRRMEPGKEDFFTKDVNGVRTPKTLREVLDMDAQKDLLAQIRSSDNDSIADVEFQVIEHIQHAIVHDLFKGNEQIDMPMDILKVQEMNCSAATLIGSGLLKELGLPHVVLGLPQHTATMIRLSNGELISCDFRKGIAGIRETDLEVLTYQGERVDLESLFTSPEGIPPEGVTAKVLSRDLIKYFNYTKGKDQKHDEDFIRISAPDEGNRINLLTNFAFKQKDPHYMYENMKRIRFNEKGDPYMIADQVYLLDEMGRSDEAAALCDASVRQNNFNADSRILRAQRNWGRGDRQTALDELSAILIKEPDNIHALKVRSNILFESKDYAATSVDVEALVRLVPDESWPLERRAELQIEQGRYQDAKETADHTITHFPENAVQFVIRATANLLLDNVDAAIADITRVLELEPQAREHLDSVVSNARSKKHCESGEKIFQQLLLTVDDGATRQVILNGRSLMLSSLARNDEALKTIDRAVAIDATQLFVQRNRGRILFDMARIDESQELFERLRETNPEDTHAAFELSRIYIHMGNLDAARAMYANCPDMRSGIDIPEEVAQIDEVERALGIIAPQEG